MKSISYVKQHLHRRHAPQYCTRCLETFATETDQRNHNETVICQFTPGKELEGITHSKREDLRRKHRDLPNDVERWFKMWDIIFPGAPRPASVYYRPDQLIDFGQLCGVVERDAGRYVVEEIRMTTGYTLRDGVSGEQVAEVGRRAMLRLLGSLGNGGECTGSHQGSVCTGSDSGVVVVAVSSSSTQSATGLSAEGVAEETEEAATNLNFPGDWWNENTVDADTLDELDQAVGELAQFDDGVDFSLYGQFS